MPRFVAITREAHANKVWQPAKNLAFAATESLLAITGSEIAKVAVAMPVAFVEQSGSYVPVAVASLQPGSNLFIGPDGQWLGRYVPVGLRSYPFRLRQAQGREVALCIDEDSGLVSDAGSEINTPEAKERFFDDDGNPTPSVKEITKRLIEIELDRKATEVAVGALNKAGVIRPWNLTVKSDRGEKQVQGLYHIDETALGALNNGEFVTLRKASALTIAYAQMFSTDQMLLLPMVARTHARLTPTRSLPPQTPLERLIAENPDGLISFD